MSLFSMAAEAAPRPAQRPSAVRQLMLLPADAIRPNPNQPRKTFDEEGIRELSRSISQAGLIQPLTVRRVPGGFELIAGERRLRACKLLGMREVPCIVQQTPQEMSAMMALIENVQRRDLHYLEEAVCYRELLHTSGLTQEQLAERLGKSQSFIANKLRLLSLPERVSRAAQEAQLTERHARALLRLGDEELELEAVREIAARALNVKETERLVARILESITPKAHPKMFRLLKDYRLFLNTVRQGADQLREAGMTVEITEEPSDDGVEMHIRICRGAPPGTASAPPAKLPG